MSLPVRERRALRGIQASLQAGDARLTEMFALFTRLVAPEVPPKTEELPSRWQAWRAARLRALALPFLIGAVACAIVAGAVAASPHGCAPTAAAYRGGHMLTPARTCPPPPASSRRPLTAGR
jgi:hypothetical protein